MSNGRPWHPKLTLKVNGLWIKVKAQTLASQVFSKHTFKIWRKKGSDFFITGALWRNEAIPHIGGRLTALQTVFKLQDSKRKRIYKFAFSIKKPINIRPSYCSFIAFCNPQNQFEINTKRWRKNSAFSGRIYQETESSYSIFINIPIWSI